MTDPIMYAVMWLALAVLMYALNITAGESWLKLTSMLSMIAFVVACVLTLLGIVVP